MGLMDRVLGCATTIVDETPLFEPALGRAHARIIVCVTHSKQDRKEERTHRHSLMRTITQRNSTTLCTLHARSCAAYSFQLWWMASLDQKYRISYFDHRCCCLFIFRIESGAIFSPFFLPFFFLWEGRRSGGEEGIELFRTTTLIRVFFTRDREGHFSDPDTDEFLSPGYIFR